MRLSKFISEAENKKTVVISVGLPGVGKSTFINKKYRGFTVISNDMSIVEYANKHNISYNEAFDKLDRLFVKGKTNSALKKAFSKGNNVVIDNTNLDKKTRKEYLDMVPEGYDKVAVVVESRSKSEHQKRLKNREGKNIPDDVMKTMKERYEKPTKSEGFNRIEFIKV